MYFASRIQAGRMLAPKIVPKFRYENCAMMAIDDGGVIVGAQIASQLHCVLTLLTSAEINLPSEPLAIAGITDNRALAYNSSYSEGEISEMLSENRGFMEQEKLRQMHELNHLVVGGGTINRRLLNGHNILIVSDGIKTAFQVDLAMEFLKPIAVEKIIFVVPFASVPAIDRMHILGDEIYCLNVLEDYRDTNHYYDTYDVPDHIKILRTIEQIVLNWK
jgi:putative phosphoribosyl transferase